ncbi:hypothetical protein BJF88_09005 [Cellulosimicrobium sp. CUA-896]|nr:hypothetical protein BJF88_09005 [Cellulosimicrobium sp. CUA-896]
MVVALAAVALVLAARAEHRVWTGAVGRYEAQVAGEAVRAEQARARAQEARVAPLAALAAASTRGGPCSRAARGRWATPPCARRCGPWWTTANA